MSRWYDNGYLDTSVSETDLLNTNTVFEKVTVNPPVILSKARLRIATAIPGTLYRVGIYDDVAGVPTNLLAQAAPFLIVSNTIYEVNLLSIVTVNAGTVWVARQYSAAGSSLSEAPAAAQNYVDTVSGGYAAGFPAVAVANPYGSDETWAGVFDSAKVTGLPQGCYQIEYSLDGINWVDISGFTNDVRTPRRSRRFAETQPQATDTPIVTLGKRMAERATLTVMYTQNDAAVFNVLRQRFEGNTLLMLRWTPGGGATGDYTFTTDAVYSYIVDMETPGADARSSADVLTAVFTVITQDATQGVVP